MYIACEKCKYNDYGQCVFYVRGSGNEIDMPCYREKELIKEAADNFIQAFVRAESEDKACKYCRYYTDEKLVTPDGKEYRFCEQSTQFRKEYTEPEDWCDRFTGASWVKG